MRSRVGLIAYADRFGGDLAGLRALLGGPLRGLFGGVHVLPFYRRYDGADAGFDPQDHTQVDPRLGSWAGIAALSAEYRVMADVIVNHVSSSCAQFQDWLAHGRASQFAGMFLTFGTVFPDGAAEDTLTRLCRPRPGLPFSPHVLADGSKALMWTTFTPQQIDMDVRHPATRLPAPRSRRACRRARRPGPARCRRLCGQDAWPDLVHDAGNVQVHRRGHRMVP
jgi:sucrose phosphorylase